MNDLEKSAIADKKPTSESQCRELSKVSQEELPKVWKKVCDHAEESGEKITAKMIRNAASERTIREWLSRIDKDAKEARNRRIFDLWLACWTNVDIASVCGCDEKIVREVIGEMAGVPKLRKDQQAASSHAVDFTPPIYALAGQSHVI